MRANMHSWSLTYFSSRSLSFTDYAISSIDFMDYISVYEMLLSTQTIAYSPLSINLECIPSYVEISQDPEARQVRQAGRQEDKMQVKFKLPVNIFALFCHGTALSAILLHFLYFFDQIRTIKQLCNILQGCFMN